VSWSERIQRRIAGWVRSRFGDRSQDDPHERGRRFMEEAIELAQALGITSEEIAQLVSYVYSRPVGKPYQEVAGVGVTLLALAECISLDFCAITEEELWRIEDLPIDHFRRRHQAKADAGVAIPPEVPA